MDSPSAITVIIMKKQTSRDSFEEFVSERYTKTYKFKDRVPKAKLDRAYKKWCKVNRKPVVKHFGEAAMRMGISHKKQQGIYYYIGLKEKYY